MDATGWTKLRGLYQIGVGSSLWVGDYCLAVVVVNKHLLIEVQTVITGRTEDGVDPWLVETDVFLIIFHYLRCRLW